MLIVPSVCSKEAAFGQSISSFLGMTSAGGGAATAVAPKQTRRVIRPSGVEAPAPAAPPTPSESFTDQIKRVQTMARPEPFTLPQRSAITEDVRPFRTQDPGYHNVSLSGHFRRINKSTKTGAFMLTLPSIVAFEKTAAGAATAAATLPSKLRVNAPPNYAAAKPADYTPVPRPDLHADVTGKGMAFARPPAAPTGSLAGRLGKGALFGAGIGAAGNLIFGSHDSEGNDRSMLGDALRGAAGGAALGAGYHYARPHITAGMHKAQDAYGSLLAPAIGSK